ncbi:hypothetical protein [Pilimelia columellifera]|uniref:STAS/SEC14 domain-containing protein n=1 Tax=Pilimelia columellifera subsp. columellifera TaxID=706583 RepID=A0ABN3NLX7_9ACTN
MHEAVAGGAWITWDESGRVATLRFTDPNATGVDAAELVDALEHWVGTAGGRFALLGDGAGLSAMDAEYRAVWAEFFGRHRAEATIGVFNLGPMAQVTARMFEQGTGVPVIGFSDEEQARQWLKGFGIGR